MKRFLWLVGSIVLLVIVSVIVGLLATFLGGFR